MGWTYIPNKLLSMEEQDNCNDSLSIPINYLPDKKIEMSSAEKDHIAHLKKVRLLRFQ